METYRFDPLRALKPACPECGQAIESWHSEVIEEDCTTGGYLEAAVAAQRFEPCGCNRLVVVRPKGDDAA